MVNKNVGCRIINKYYWSNLRYVLWEITFDQKIIKGGFSSVGEGFKTFNYKSPKHIIDYVYEQNQQSYINEQVKITCQYRIHSKLEEIILQQTTNILKIHKFFHATDISFLCKMAQKGLLSTQWLLKVFAVSSLKGNTLKQLLQCMQEKGLREPFQLFGPSVVNQKNTLTA